MITYLSIDQLPHRSEPRRARNAWPGIGQAACMPADEQAGALARAPSYVPDECRVLIPVRMAA